MLSKRKQRSENFDVTEFLRPTDTDLKSALTSLLTHPVADDHHSAEVVTVQRDALADVATPSSEAQLNTAPGSLYNPGPKYIPDLIYLPDANKVTAPIDGQQGTKKSGKMPDDNTAPGSI